MASSSALLGAAGPASADVVQITLIDQITTTNTGVERNTIDGDFTGDGVIDMSNVVGNYFPAQEYVNLLINSVKVAYAGSTNNQLSATVNGVSAPPATTWFVTQSGIVPITFRDSRINGGAVTSAFIEVRSVAANQAAKIQVLRTVFDDESTAAPAGVAAGGSNPEFDPARAGIEAAERAVASARKASLANEIKKLKKKIKNAKKSGKSAKAKKLKKKLKKSSREFAALS